MSNIALYKLADDYNALMDLEGEEDIQDALLAIIGKDIERKAENICKLVTMLEASAAQFREEEKRIANRRKAMENRAENIREYMKNTLLEANIEKVEAGTFKVSISLSPGSVSIDDLEAIPPRFLTVIPEQFVPDKNAIKAAIKNGEEVRGAHIEAGFTLRIK